MTEAPHYRIPQDHGMAWVDDEKEPRAGGGGERRATILALERPNNEVEDSHKSVTRE